MRRCKLLVSGVHLVVTIGFFTYKNMEMIWELPLCHGYNILGATKYTYFRKNNIYYCGDNIKHCGSDDTYCFCPFNK